MKRRQKIWDISEDEALQKVCEGLSPPINWKEVVQEIKDKHQLVGVTFKDCRERWYSIVYQQGGDRKWGETEELLLLEKQSLIGNKWLELCQFFPDRRQTFLKNQFYSIFKRALKKANIQLYTYKNNRIRPITKSLMLKALMVCEGKFNKGEGDSLIKTVAEQLKSTLIYYLYNTPSHDQGATRIEVFLKIVNDFRKLLKGKALDATKETTVKLQLPQEQPLPYFFQTQNQQQIPHRLSPWEPQTPHHPPPLPPKVSDAVVETLPNTTSTSSFQQPPPPTLFKMQEQGLQAKQERDWVTPVMAMPPMGSFWYPIYQQLIPSSIHGFYGYFPRGYQMNPSLLYTANMGANGAPPPYH